jgi:microcystin-dependent protein
MTAFIGEIRLFGGNFAPAGWEFCNGQLLPISGNDALFQLIGTTYGGDGQTTFALPNLQSRIPIHVGSIPTHDLGESAGVESVTLTVQQIPAHSHAPMGSGSTASATSPAGNVGARVTAAAVFPYGTDNPPQPLSAQAVAPAGGSQPHDNMQPYLCVNFIIALSGVFPSQT